MKERERCYSFILSRTPLETSDMYELIIFLDNSYQRKKETELRQKRLLEQEVQLHRLRNAPGGNENPLSMAFNPHYGSESILPQGIDVRGLPQVSRESLKLVK
jgi:hypothetical protein